MDLTTKKAFWVKIKSLGTVNVAEYDPNTQLWYVAGFSQPKAGSELEVIQVINPPSDKEPEPEPDHV